MCLLTYFPPRATVDAERLRNGSVTNNDGHGWAVIHSDGRSILSGHSMDFETALAEFIAARIMHPETDGMFHSRFTTHGLTNVDNCHPFYVPKLRDTVVGHNGVLPCSPGKGDWRSDTRLFTEDILMRRFPALDSPKTIRRLEQWMGYNKILILTVDPRYRLNAYLIKGNLGEWVDGVWYSNSGHEKKKPWSGYVSSGRWVKNGAGNWALETTKEVSTLGSLRGEYDSWDEWWDEKDAEADRRWASARAQADRLISESGDGDDGMISLPLIRESGALYYDRSGREGAVLGPREPSVRPRAEYIPERWQCPDEVCRSFNIEAEAGICLACMGCLTCAEHVSECGCDADPEMTEIEQTEARITAAVSAFRDMGVRVSEYMQDTMREMTAEGLDRVILRVSELKKMRDEAGDTREARLQAAEGAVTLVMDINRVAAEATGWPKATSVNGAAEGMRAIAAAAASATPGIITSIGVDADAPSSVTVASVDEGVSA